MIQTKSDGGDAVPDQYPGEDHAGGGGGRYVVCLIAMRYAHRFRVRLLAVNTAVHELLHVLWGGVFAERGGRWRRAAKEHPGRMRRMR